MDWYKATGEYHMQTTPPEHRLSSLPEEWQRELAALWRLEADVNNGAYLQFLSNWGRESYVYASQALKKIGAHTMAEIIDSCQALVDEHFSSEDALHNRRHLLMPNELIGLDGELMKEAGSVLPQSVIDRIMDLSYQFMAYPDDLAVLGMKYYRHHFSPGSGRETQ